MTTVRTERADRVMTVMLDNPPRNFLGRHVIADLDRVLRSLERDRTIRAVVVTGAHPRAFITHYDVAEILASAKVTPDLPPAVFDVALRAVGAIARIPGGAAALTRNRFTRARVGGLLTAWRLHQMDLRMNRMDKVFVAAINGNAAAGGCELALACDVRLMADGDFTIGLTEPVLGFNPGGGGGQRLARAVGPGRAVEMLLEAHMYSPREAREVGLVHRVVAPERLLDEARATAARLGRRAPRAVWAVKRAVYEGFSAPWPKGLHLDRAGFAAAAVAPAVKDAMRTMLEQIESLPAEQTPSPWADRELLRAWQEGTVVDFGR